uniref:Syntenin-1-like n=1 Tax=Sinocyclocheilus rhinocerous TaxID=307959 RepID=A0A673KH85_9TELE
QGVYQPQPATQGMPSSTLYPNLEELGDYMGLSLNSDEVQRNLALVPVADNVRGGCVSTQDHKQNSEICDVKYFVFCLQDTQIKDILTTSPTAMTITIMPKFIYEHMIKNLMHQMLIHFNFSKRK